MFIVKFRNLLFGAGVVVVVATVVVVVVLVSK
jgi:hypothetical protein